ncbi:methyl-accepting chemotaxis protein [Paenibacillus sp. MER 180]|uniref:methyl-accepting chemotaxis protein n=1 Tax=Paenibacillus sp. MER 180 TaxID=2939570 RepID=UPI0020415E7D|nr:methyl-accepting chemotaxis protein [Paenibacillus sp. MER 180]MCM3288955.1 methyl-accepting chemotaxis protein [Paenibacillus sp. MER 180]
MEFIHFYVNFLNNISILPATNWNLRSIYIGCEEGCRICAESIGWDSFTKVEAATAMNEMAIGITRVAEAASEVASVAIRASENAVIGNQQLIETVGQMERIKKTQADSAQIVAKLDEHSVRIGQIIKSIMEIAGQTKLLALNAKWLGR